MRVEWKLSIWLIYVKSFKIFSVLYYALKTIEMLWKRLCLSSVLCIKYYMMRDTIFQQQIKRKLIFCWQELENSRYPIAFVS